MHALSAGTSSPAFSPEALIVMGHAFDSAWISLEPRRARHGGDDEALREMLALNILMAARLGETNEDALAHSAVRRLGPSV
jgi:hypothetical protein